PAHVLAGVPIVAVEMHIALINPRSRLAIIPPVFAPVRLRAERRVEPIGVARTQLTAVDRRMVEKIVVAPRRIGGTFQANNAAQLVLMLGRQLEHNGAAHRQPITTGRSSASAFHTARTMPR